MRPSPNILLAVLEDLVEYWRSQAILATPEGQWDAMVVAQANGVILPPDFVQLYQCSNGMQPKRYCDTDEKGFHFLSADELRTEQRELIVDSMTGIAAVSAEVTVFVDYMQWSWQYAFISDTATDEYQIGIMGNSDEFKVITSSLATFLSLYMENAPVLYDWAIYPNRRL